tara:strand:+ start:124 stop:1185 length:1062 start_codon:yes stop_codon:yes gene_type:complete
MNSKKYNTSLSSLYEGLERLDTIYHQRAGGRDCRIDVPDNVRQFLFSVGEYAVKDDKGQEVPAHTSVAGFLSNNLPVNIFRSIEKAVANKENFEMIMSGPVADFSKLFLSEIDCAIIQLGLDKLSVFLTTTTKFKGNVKQSQERIKDLESDTALAPIVGGSTLVESVYTATTSLAAEEQQKINEIIRRQRIDASRFNTVFRPLNSRATTGVLDQRVFFFENFFKEYYDNTTWDANKLREDIDLIMSKANSCRRIREGSLDAMYQSYMSAIDAKTTRETETLLENLDKSTDAEGKKYFKRKLGLMIFLDSYPESCFFGIAYYHLKNNKELRKQFSNEIKEMLKDYHQRIQSIFL